MKFYSLKKWKNPESCRALVYFAQLFEEMLFKFSLDTYKPSIMHAGLLCIEALQTLDEIDEGNIAEPNIRHVVAELCFNLSRDTVAMALLPLPTSSITAVLKNKKLPLNEIRDTVELLRVHLSIKNYFQKNKEMLSESVINNFDFSDIRNLSRTFLATLISMGFSSDYIREKSRDFFFFGEEVIEDNFSIKKFLDVFKWDKNNYNVFFRVGEVFHPFSSALKGLKIDISEESPKGFGENDFPSFFLKDKRLLFAKTEGIQARDPYAARQVVENRMKLCAAVLNLFHHKQTPSWMERFVICEVGSENFKMIGQLVNPMHRCVDLKENVAAKRLHLFLKSFSLEQKSFSKFVRSAELHSMALSSNADENQMINLWIALESLVPTESKSDDVSNIEHIINSLTPFLNEKYIQNLLNNLVKDLLRWRRREMTNIFRRVEGKKLVDRLAKILSLPDYKNEYEDLKENCKDFYLLSERVLYFHNLLKSPGDVALALEGHKERVEWQIRRIYRTRNIIVHTGRTPWYTRPLIDHTHNYLDIIISRLIELASEPKMINSVSQGFGFIRLKYKKYISSLGEENVCFTEKNIDELLFG